MRHRVTLQTRVSGLDAAGGVRNTWENFATRWASVDFSPGSEVRASAQRSGRVPAVFRLRYLDGVEPKMRLLHKSKVYEIISAVDQASRREELIITAEELVEATP
jgi:SPP1 family predicted phage head-tail adaptor